MHFDRACSQSAATLLGALMVACCGLSGAGAQSGEGMSFFITSEGPSNGADLGGLAGADQHCQTLAGSVGAGDRTWRAYLSTGAGGGDQAAGINARDRIGSGPWYNAQGVRIADDVEDLHGDSNNLNKETALTETGGVVNGRGDSPNQHDILTGSQLDGTAFAGDADLTCGNWTSSAGGGSAQVGHHDRQGGGANPTSWNSAHASRGCDPSGLRSTGGNGYFYCFAADSPDGETAVEEAHTSGQPASFGLTQNFPNPFNSATVIRFDLARGANVELAVYNLAGQKITTLVSGSRGAGRYTVRWDGRADDGRALASGIYLYRLEATDRAPGSLVQTRKLLLIR